MSLEEFQTSLHAVMQVHGKELTKRKSFLLARIKFGSEAEQVLGTSKKRGLSHRILANALAKDIRKHLKDAGTYAGDRLEHEKRLKRLLKPLAYLAGSIDTSADTLTLTVATAKVWDRSWFKTDGSLKLKKSEVLLPLLRAAKGVNSKKDFRVVLPEPPASELDDAAEEQLEAESQREVESLEAMETKGALTDEERLEHFLFENGALIDEAVLTTENAQLVARFLAGTPTEEQKARVAEAVERLSELAAAPDPSELATGISELAQALGAGASPEVDAGLRESANRVALSLLGSNIRAQIEEIRRANSAVGEFLKANVADPSAVAQAAKEYLPRLYRLKDAVLSLRSQVPPNDTSH